jgi:hypothetical protein
MQRDTTPQIPVTSSEAQQATKSTVNSVPQPLTEGQLRQVGGGLTQPAAPNKTW